MLGILFGLIVYIKILENSKRNVRDQYFFFFGKFNFKVYVIKVYM